MGGKVDEGIRKKEETEGKGRRIEGGGGGKVGPREALESPREAPGRPESDPRGGPGGPARPQELPRDPSILQEMQFIKNRMIFIDHWFQVAEAQDDASIEAFKGFRK